MNRFLYTENSPMPKISILLMGVCLSASLGLGTPLAQAERYTQIFPSAAPLAVSGPIGVIPPRMQGTPPITGRVYQAQSGHSSPLLLPVRAVKSLNQPLMGPQAILDFIKTKAGIPATVASAITVEKSSVLNSYTDGQRIVITSSLLEKLPTNDERAFVISHELSHVLLSHVTKTEVRRMGLSLFDAFIVQRYVGKGTPLDSATRFGLGLVDMRSSRGYEYQADDLGVRLMTEAGYNPEAAIQVFGILKANTPANQTPGFLMDHPITDDRIQALVRKYQLRPN